MSGFKKKKKDSPGINTAALPDIVFMLLFFFMVATVVREDSFQVRFTRPEATEVTKIEDRSKVFFIYVGPPLQPEVYGAEARIQVGGAIVPDAIYVQNAINMWRGRFAEAEYSSLFVSLKGDQDTKMFVINQVKENLREVNALKLVYSTKRRSAE